MTVSHAIVWRFQRPDGRWMRVNRDAVSAAWADWVDRFDDATTFLHADGLKGDHRWEWMLGDAKPVAFTRTTTEARKP